MRALATSLDAPRNWDVLAEQVLRPVTDSRPEDKVFRRLRVLTGRERQSAYQRLKEIIDAPENMVAILRLARWFEAAGWRGEQLSAQAAQLTQPITLAFQTSQIAHRTQETALHDRISGVPVRYLRSTAT